MGILEPSAWVKYPAKYRFIGLQIFMNMDRHNIKRQFPRTTDVLRDLGGIYTTLSLIFTFIVVRMSRPRMMSILTSHLYKEEIPEVQDEFTTIHKHHVN